MSDVEATYSYARALSVDNTGATDVTTALQAAITHAHNAFLAV